MQPSIPPERALVYFGYSPAEGAGSAIIVYRHLRRFAEAGWKVHVVADWGQDDSICRRHGWPVMTLSHRRPWWPPFHPDRKSSRTIRAWLWAGEVHGWLKPENATAVFTYLSAFSDTLSIAAVGFAQRYRLPLSTIIHDDARCFGASAQAGEHAHARRQWILERSTKCWFASPGLAACFRLRADQIGVLPPIPEGFASVDKMRLNAEKDGAPLLIYAGNYWPAQLPTLARLAAATRTAGGRFLAVLKEDPGHVAYLRERNVEWRQPFACNIEALEFFRTEAAAMVVSYADSTDEMPWTRTSFPSKLIEYCHLGIPIVIVASDETAVALWAKRRNFHDIYSPHDLVGFSKYVNRLRNQEFCQERRALALLLAHEEFNPAEIHKQLQQSLITHKNPNSDRNLC